MADVRHDAAFTSVVEQLTVSREELGQRGLFKTYKDLTKYAAMVGYKFGKKRQVEEVGREIPQRIFENSNDNDLVYLLAIAKTNSSDVLGEEDEASVYRIFEEYANGGLEIIQGWLEDNSADLTGLRTLLKKTYEQMELAPESNGKEIEF